MDTHKMKSHNSALSLQETEALGFTQLPQPPYSSDLTPCHFFRFGYLKKELDAKNFRSQNAVITAVKTTLTKIPFKSSQESFTNGSKNCTGVPRMTGSTSK
jgi:hypothetical protein